MGEDLVTIIIPTYYRDHSLKNAIESALAQSYENIEVIVVDDSGEKYAKPIVEEYEVKYIAHEENQGGNPARNTGYRASSGNYIQLLDDDDEIFEDKISEQIKLLKGSPSVGVAYCGIVNRDGTKIYPDPEDRGRSLELALQFFWPTTITSSLLISSDIFSKIYPLTDRAAADDIGMKIELAKRTDFDFVDKILVKIGDSMNSRSTGMGFITELESIYKYNEEEYNEMPDYVERYALSDMYWAKAQTILAENTWSLSAIYSYTLAIIYRPEFEITLLCSGVASIFGKPGLSLGRWIYGYLQKIT